MDVVSGCMLATVQYMLSLFVSTVTVWCELLLVASVWCNTSSGAVQYELFLLCNMSDLW